MGLVGEYKGELGRNVTHLNCVYDNVFKFDKLMDFRNKDGFRNRLADLAFAPLLISYYAVAFPLMVGTALESSVRTVYRHVVGA